MSVRTRLAGVLGAVGLAAAAAYAPAALADRVGFNISVGGPGYAFSVGNPGGYFYAPPPVIVGPPVPFYRPHRPFYAPVVVAPPVVVVRPYPVYRPQWRDGNRHQRWDRNERWDRRDRRDYDDQWRHGNDGWR